MARKRYVAEEIIGHLRTVELDTEKGWPCSTPAGSSASPSKDARSASQRGTVLHAERSPDHHRTLEDSLQHGPSAQQSRGPATRSRNYPACELRTNMEGGTKTPGWSPIPPAPALFDEFLVDVGAIQQEHISQRALQKCLRNIKVWKRHTISL